MSGRIVQVSAGAATVVAAVLLAGCNSSDTPSTTTTSSTSSTTTSSTSTTPSPTSTEPTEAEEAAEAVVEFYKEIDAVAQGTARLDSFRYATTYDGLEGSLPKWQGLLMEQLRDGYTQVGATLVEVLATKEGEPKEVGSNTWPSWTVTACVDHSAVHLERDGKEVQSGAPERELVSHTVIDATGDFAVLEDEPGKSC